MVFLLLYIYLAYTYDSMDRSFHVLSFGICCLLLCGFTGDVAKSRKVDFHFVAKISEVS